MSKATLYDKFNTDKESTLGVIQEFLQSTPKSPTIAPEDLGQYRRDAVTLVSQGKFTEALQTLERLRDAKSGIVMQEITKDGVPVIIRDARAAKIPPVRETEAFEMQYLNAVRAGMDIAEIAGNSSLKEVLSAEATKFMQEFSENKGLSQKGLSQEELAGLLKKQIKNLGKTLEANGIPDAYKKLNIAKDFQNFNDKHSNIVTVSSIEHNGQKHTVIEAEVAMKGLTENQKKQYESILQRRTKTFLVYCHA
jgi:transcriptional regulator with XRE-family HTH domain